MNFAWIPSGTFLMGSPKEAKDREGYDGADETQHKVTLSKGFYMGVHPITRGQFAAFVEQTGYKTQAEAVREAEILTATELEFDNISYWQNPDFEQTKEHPVACESE